MKGKLVQIPLLAVAVVLFSACSATAPSENGQANVMNNGNSRGGITEERVREIVREEIANQPSISPEMDEITGEIDTAALGDDEFYVRVTAAIERYVQEQEEAARKAQEEANKPKFVEGVSVDDDPVLGDPNAPVTIVEFSDFECPFCGRHFEQTYPQIKENYIDTGKVKYVFRDFPLNFHPNAMPASVAANCVLEQAGDEAYFDFHDRLFSNQQDLNEEAYISYVNELGLDEAQFTQCFEANDTEEIENDLADGQEYGVSGTPGFFINGWALKGAYPYPAFEELIEQELAKVEQ